MSLREKLLGLPPKIETIPDCGGGLDPVTIRVMSGEERAKWQQETYLAGDKVDPVHYFARLLVRCFCDAAGARIFKDDEVELLSKVDGAVLERCFWLARKLNKLDAGALDAAKKDLPAKQKKASGTLSPAI